MNAYEVQSIQRVLYHSILLVDILPDLGEKGASGLSWNCDYFRGSTGIADKQNSLESEI